MSLAAYAVFDVPMIAVAPAIDVSVAPAAMVKICRRKFLVILPSRVVLP